MGSIQQGLNILSGGSSEFATGSAIADSGFELISVVLGVFADVVGTVNLLIGSADAPVLT